MKNPPPEGKHKLSLFALISMSVGLTIGGGLFVLTGTLAKETGFFLPVAYLVAAVPMFFIIFPIASLGAFLPATGGNYFYVSRFLSPMLGFIIAWFFVLTACLGQIPLFTLTAAEITKNFFPFGSKEIWAFGILSFFYLLNLIGIKPVLIIQNIMVSVLVIALLFCIFRITDISNIKIYSFDSFPKFTKLLSAASLLSFTFFGSNAIVELGKETKNPRSVLVRAFSLSYPLVVILYISFSLSIVSNLERNHNFESEDLLVQVVKTKLNSIEFIIFMLGGPMLAVVTSLNGIFLIVSRSLHAMTEDKIFPAILNKNQFGLSYPATFTIIYALACFGLFLNHNLEILATYSTIGWFLVVIGQLYCIIIIRSILKVQKQEGGLLSSSFILISVILGTISAVFFTGTLVYNLTKGKKLFDLFFIILIGIIYFFVRSYILKRNKTNFNHLNANPIQTLKQNEALK
ncbi:putative amino acid permease YhdG [Leptospira kobayashii]|uniref:Amino acid permease YhdG n=1 Tax=Leptospira kobayashii TaxID=1917830 RepID=A0ABN6KC09_9LEPT|nr:APC family permease [Leptospira kobayashii]BDA78514.1 putative amino acid permease YhdG [Leptospira kobayashii]